VGGWASRGVDAGRFSRALLRGVLDGLRRTKDLPVVSSEAFQAIRDGRIRGSCTLLVCNLEQDIFSALNLGDCGLLVLRPTLILPRVHGGTVTTTMRRLYRSSNMIHRQNMPYQLNAEDLDMSALEPHDLVTLKLRRGDILIAGTDGLFDNIGDRELTAIVLAHHAVRSRTATGGSSSTEMATVELAKQLLERASEAARSPVEYLSGGKLDDIAVVVAEAHDWEPAVSEAILGNLDE